MYCVHVKVSLSHIGLDYKLGLTAGQVVRLIGLLLVVANQKIVHNVRNEMAELSH